MNISTSQSSDRILWLLSEYDFRLNKSVTDDVICIKCKGILIEACQMKCGRNICRKCADMCIANKDHGSGTNNEFELDNLADIVTDYRINNLIAKLIVECPIDTCRFEGMLKDMDGHLRVCPMKNLKCPFQEIGCNHGNSRCDIIDEHLRLECYNHNKILIDMICNLRNEITELKRSDEMNKNEMKIRKEEIKSMKMELCQFGTDNESVKNITESEEVKQGSKTDFEEVENEDIENSEFMTWKLDSIPGKFGSILSPIFSPQTQRFEIQLEMWNSIDRNIYLRLRLFPGDPELQWPFKADVTIKIVSNENHDSFKDVTKFCQIEKPSQNGHLHSDRFVFNFRDLVTRSLIQNNSFTVICLVDFK